MSRTKVGLALLAVGALLAACGSQGSSTGESSATTPQSSPATTTQASTGAGSGGAASSGSVPASAGGSLLIYNAQHENLTKAWADAFTTRTGIKVEIRSGDDLEMGNQLVAEGAASPADVFITENSPGMNLVDKAGLFAGVDKATLSAVPSQYSPADGKWVGVAARSTVFVYNTSKLKEADLPASLMDLADAKWKGRWGASPGGADFQAIVSAMLALKGEDATRSWLTAAKENAKPYKGNSTVMKAVNAGEIDGGVIYHYYWYGDQAKTKENSANTALHFFGGKDPGAFVSVSGAGVLASSKHQEQAQQFLKFITGPEGQKIVADTVVEYPLTDVVTENNKALKPLSTLDAPTIDPATLNSPQVTELMTEAGLL